MLRAIHIQRWAPLPTPATFLRHILNAAYGACAAECVVLECVDYAHVGYLSSIAHAA